MSESIVEAVRSRYGSVASRVFVLRAIIVSYPTVRRETMKSYLGKPAHFNSQTNEVRRPTASSLRTQLFVPRSA